MMQEHAADSRPTATKHTESIDQYLQNESIGRQLSMNGNSYHSVRQFFQHAAGRFPIIRTPATTKPPHSSVHSPLHTHSMSHPLSVVF